jgi:23S rRNA (guanosine2251-2'-O)-methyltransferase
MLRKSVGKGPRKQASQAITDRFVIEGLSAVNEHIKFRPTSLKCIVGREEYIKRLMPTPGDLRVIGVDEYRDENPTGSDFSKAPIWAEVVITSRGELDLLEHIKAKQPKVILALDHVSDPRNLGAIARSAAFFGVDCIVAPKDRQVLLTQSSVATSQGAFALTDLYAITNLGRTIKQLKDHGYWVIGTAMEGEPLGNMVGFYDKIVLVLGSEGKGIGKLVKQYCDRLASIPSRQGDGLESLNVSVAAGISLFCFTSLGNNR